MVNIDPNPTVYVEGGFSVNLGSNIILDDADLVNSIVTVDEVIITAESDLEILIARAGPDSGITVV